MLKKVVQKERQLSSILKRLIYKGALKNYKVFIIFIK